MSSHRHSQPCVSTDTHTTEAIHTRNCGTHCMCWRQPREWPVQILQQTCCTISPPPKVSQVVLHSQGDKHSVLTEGSARPEEDSSRREDAQSNVDSDLVTEAAHEEAHRRRDYEIGHEVGKLEQCGLCLVFKVEHLKEMLVLDGCQLPFPASTAMLIRILDIEAIQPPTNTHKHIEQSITETPT